MSKEDCDETCSLDTQQEKMVVRIDIRDNARELAKLVSEGRKIYELELGCRKIRPKADIYIENIGVLTKLFQTIKSELVSLEVKLPLPSLGTLRTEIIATLCGSFSTLSNLRNFNLTLLMVKVGEDGYSILANSIGRMAKLDSLKISLSCVTNVNDRTIDYMSKNLVKLTNLLVLDINLVHSNISDIGLNSLSESLSKMRSLEQLYVTIINKDRLTEQSFLTFFAAFQELNNLALMDVNVWLKNTEETQINDEALMILSQSLSKMSTLSSLKLNLKKSKITDKGTLTFIKAASECVNMEALNINMSQTSISDEVCYFFSEAIGKMQKLQHFILYVSNTHITCNGIFKLYHTIYMTKSMENVRIDTSKDMPSGSLNCTFNPAEAKNFGDLLNDFTSVGILKPPFARVELGLYKTELQKIVTFFDDHIPKRLFWVFSANFAYQLISSNNLDLIRKLKQFKDVTSKVSLNMDNTCELESSLVEFFEAVTSFKSVRGIGFGHLDKNFSEKNIEFLNDKVKFFKKSLLELQLGILYPESSTAIIKLLITVSHIPNLVHLKFPQYNSQHKKMIMSIGNCVSGRHKALNQIWGISHRLKNFSNKSRNDLISALLI